MSRFDLFAPIAKVDAKQRMVWGWASTETKDLQGEIVKSDAIEKALPDYREWANIREMHRPSAVGVAKEAEMQDRPDGSKGLWLGAKIVDDTAWNKVEEGVYKGFSIGGERLAKVGNEITEIRVVEISLVDRPANPDCKIEVVKGAFMDGDEGDDPLLVAKVDVTDETSVLKAAFEKLAYAFGFQKKELSTASVNDLPDSDFAYIEPGGDKDEDGKTKPRSLRHFPINDAAHVRNALARASQSPFGDKAMPKIKSAAKKFGIEISEDTKKDAAAEATSVTKSMYEVGRMADIYESLQGLKRSLKTESIWEGDEADMECAGRIREAAQMLGEIILAHTQHEMDEDAEDEEDAAHVIQGELSMAAEAKDVTKRFGKVHKGALMKAASHLEKAADAHEKMKGHMDDAMKGFGAMTKAAKDGKKTVDMDEMKGHLDKAMDAHEMMGDHLDVAQAHMEKGLAGWDESDINEDTHDEAEAKAEAKKAAAVDPEDIVLNALMKSGNVAAMKKYIADREANVAEVASVKKAASTPAGNPRVRVMSVSKGAVEVENHNDEVAGGDPTSGLNMEPKTEREAANTASKIFAKMLTGGMGKSILTDPSFRGAGAR